MRIDTSRPPRILPLVLVLAALATALGARAHVETPLLPEECGSCHVGHGMSAQPMLEFAEEEFCYQCHGSDERRSAMVSDGRLSPAARPADIERELAKPYRHPVEEGFGHSPTERLPSFSGSSPGHAECVDCHNPHQRLEPGRPAVFEVPGYSLSGQYLETSVREYQVCLKCHSDRQSFGLAGPSLIREFATTVRSQHPVTRPSTGRRKPSLQGAATTMATMRCSDCHTNDDPDGPRGPHGSNYPFLLSGNYTTDIRADESPIAYEFCYSCHDRSSLLSNDSFPYHQEHIVGDPLAGRPGTSCYTCHASHGSPDSPHLIDFNPKAVTRERITGLLEYRALGEGRGECYLSCHGHEHGPERY